MSTLNAELREIIDQQDIDEIQHFIINHPDFNYNHISPNGASALWWALMPSQGNIISAEVLQYLLDSYHNDGTPLVNPTQILAGLTPSQYLGLIEREDVDFAREAIIEAENNYQAPEGLAGNNNNLAAFANDRQSAHNHLVTGLSRNNTVRLIQHYVKEQGIVLDMHLLNDTYVDINEFIKQRIKSQPDSAQQMKFGLDFCYQNKSQFSFSSLEESDLWQCSFSLAKLTALIWLAAKETNPDLLPEGSDNDEGLASRKEAVLNILYDIATAYGQNRPSCAGGACNRLGMTLAVQHRVVHAYPKNKCVDGAAAQIIIIRVLGQTLERLCQQNQNQYLGVMRYLTLDKYTQEDELCYQKFIESQSESLAKQLIEEESIEVEMATQYLDGLVDEYCPVYPLSSHPTSHYLQNIMRLFQDNGLDLSLFYQEKKIDVVLNESKKILATELISSESFQALLGSQQIELQALGDLSFAQLFITHWLECARRIGSKESLNVFFQNNEDLDIQQVALETLMLTVFTAKKDDLKNNHPQQALWIESLINQEIIDLMMVVNHKNPDILTTDGFDLIQKLISYAMEFGITANLSLKDLHFENEDLRAWDLSGVNFNDVILKNCQLPLTGVNTQCYQVKLFNCSLSYIDENSSLEDISKLFITLCKLNTPPAALTTQFLIQSLKNEGLKRVDKLRQTALNVLVKQGYIDCVKAILESEYCSSKLLEIEKKYGGTALTTAAYYGHSDCLKALLESKHCTEDLLHISTYGSNALHEAAKKGHLDCLEALFESKYFSASLLESTDIYGLMALSKAAESGHTDCLNALLESEYCSEKLFKMKDKKGRTPLILAAENGHIDCLKALLKSEHCPSNVLGIRDEFSYTALHNAVWNRKIDCVEALIQSGNFSSTHLNITSGTGTSVLMIAARVGSLDCLKALLECKHYSKTLFMMKDKLGNTALTSAVLRKHIDCLRALLESKDCSSKFLKITDMYGRTALSRAVQFGYMDSVMAILESKHCTLEVLEVADKWGVSVAQSSDKKYPAITQALRRYTVYLKAWQSEGSVSEKIALLLRTCCMKEFTGVAKNSLFNNDSQVKNQKIKIIDAYLYDYQSEIIDRTTLFEKLKNAPGLEKDDTFSKCIQFIESRVGAYDSEELIVSDFGQCSYN